MIGFLLLKSTLWYNHSFEQMFLLIWTGFSGERCGPWASCLYLSSEPTCLYNQSLTLMWTMWPIGHCFKPVQWIHVCNNDNFALLELTLIFYFPLNRWNYLLADHPWVFLHRRHLVKVSVWFFVSTFIKVLSGPHCFSPSSKGSTGIHPSNKFSSADYFCVLHVV